MNSSKDASCTHLSYKFFIKLHLYSWKHNFWDQFCLEETILLKQGSQLKEDTLRSVFNCLQDLWLGKVRFGHSWSALSIYICCSRSSQNQTQSSIEKDAQQQWVEHEEAYIDFSQSAQGDSLNFIFQDNYKKPLQSIHGLQDLSYQKSFATHILFYSMPPHDVMSTVLKMSIHVQL